MSSYLLYFIIGILALVAGTLMSLFLKKNAEVKKLRNRFGGIVDIEQEIESVQDRLSELKGEHEQQTLIYGRKNKQLTEEFEHKNEWLSSEYANKRKLFDRLSEEVAILHEDLEDSSFGLYEAHFEFDDSEAYKKHLKKIKELQKIMVREKRAAVCAAEWKVSGSIKEGRKMTGQYTKVMLRSFNNECDAAILKTNWNNATQMEKRIESAYHSINRLGKTYQIEITSPYLDLKLNELKITHEYKQKKQEEKEEQREIKQQMREEERARRETEKAQKDAEAEERRYEKALAKAKRDMEEAQGEQSEKFKSQIRQLQEQLAKAQEMKERAISRAQITRSGYVYIISNLGSFGENIYKIGMTRRLEPMDRVKELGDASVPFTFDVHAMIYSEDAPTIEKQLHHKFDGRRMNMVNKRKEFFRVTLAEIEEEAHKLDAEIEFTKVAEAREYRETQALLKKLNEKESTIPIVEQSFPDAL